MQIFAKAGGNEIIALTSSFLLGLSRSWWIEKHNRHHSNPNQLEHHLFPNMPRNNLGKARQLVKRFCAQRGVRYTEVGMLRSYQEFIEFLHQVSAPLRRKAAGTSP